MKNELGQLLIVGLQGTTLQKDEAQFLTDNNIGGVILFDRNIESPQQLHKLCSDIQSLRHKLPRKSPFFISIDMEGGRVQRLKPPFTPWPPARKLGDLDSTSLAFKFALALGEELKAVGINLNFAPCVDVLTNPENKVIGNRALSDQPEQVGKMASALVRGFIKAEVIPCAKHFPGHGNTLVDSHEDLPIEDTSFDQLLKRELLPFKKAFRARLDIVMTSHIKFSQIDNDHPVTLSRHFLKDLLRKEFRYQNLIISDDLDMKALRNHYSREEIAVKALQAGCDILLYCNEPESPHLALESIHKALSDGELLETEITNSLDRIKKLKTNKIKNPDPIEFQQAISAVGHPNHSRIAKAIANGEIPSDLA